MIILWREWIGFMRRKKRIFIAIGILINVLLCLGLYVNNRLDHMVAGLYGPGVVNTDNSIQPGEFNTDSAATVPNGSAISPGGNGTNTPGSSSSPGNITKPSKQDLASGVEQKLGRPVEKKDLIKAGMIILRKLNWDEITFLYNAGSKTKQTSEELKQAREILKGKLSAEELATLQELGNKYGQSFRFLN